jgi:hypothetical protein
MLTEFDDYRIDGALKAAKEQHAAALTDSAMFDLLCESFDAWNGEEVSVKEEHADLIEKSEAFINAARPRFSAPICMEDLIEKDAADRAADPVKAALLDCIGALSASMDQIHQMRGMFDDADGTIQDALDAAEDAQAKAREALA